MGQPAPVVRLLWISRSIATVSAVRLRYVDLRPACVRGSIWPRLDRQRPTDSAPSYWRRRSREDRDHGGVDYRNPSGWQRLCGLLGWRAADHIRHLSGSLHTFRDFVDCCGLDGAVRRHRRSRAAAGDHRDIPALNGDHQVLKLLLGASLSAAALKEFWLRPR